MNWKTYTQGVLLTANPALSHNEAVLSATLGLVGEAAEVSELLKRHYFHGKPLVKENLLKEIGDVCYYLAWLSHLQGIDLNYAMEANLEKLRQRHPQGFSAIYHDQNSEGQNGQG